MTDVSKRTREKAPGKAGQFATEPHSPAGFELQPPAPAPFTMAELERVKSLHGTSSADSARDYYPTMRKVLDGAGVLARVSEDDLREAAVDSAVSKCAAKYGTHPAALKTFYEDVRHTEPGTKQWVQAVKDAYYSPAGVDRLQLHEDLLQAEHEAHEAVREDRRRVLIQARTRIDAELAELDA